MSNSKNNMNDAILIESFVLLIIGVRLVTQAGQEGVVIQNDGYAGSGAAVIFVAGTLFGVWLKQARFSRKK